MAVAWPDLAELKQALDVDSTDFDGDEDDTRLTRALGSAIDRVKTDVVWDDATDAVTERLAQAAFRAAVLIATTNEGIAALDRDEKYAALLKGYRKRWGIA